MFSSPRRQTRRPPSAVPPSPPPDSGAARSQVEIKRAFKVLADEAETVRDRIREMQTKHSEATKIAKRAQEEWSQGRALEERADAELADRDAKVEEAKAKAEAVAKATQHQALIEKKKAEAVAKAAFDAKVAMKRDGGSFNKSHKAA